MELQKIKSLLFYGVMIVIFYFAPFFMFHDMDGDTLDIVALKDSLYIKRIAENYGNFILHRVSEHGYDLLTSTIYTDSIIHSVYYWGEVFSVDPIVCLSMIYEESHFDPRAVGSSADSGLLQITHYAVKEYEKHHDKKGVSCLNIDYNVEVGIWYLKSKLDENSQNLKKAQALYNAGSFWKTHGMEYVTRVEKKKKLIIKLCQGGANGKI